jgi:hypothetical protein
VAVGLLLGVQRLLPAMLPVLAWPLRRRPETGLAVRSPLRHRRRSGLTVGALGLGLILVISIGTLTSSLVGRWYEDARKQHPADIQLEVPGVYVRGVSADLARQVTAVPGVTLVATVGDDAPTLLVDYDWSRATSDYRKERDEANRQKVRYLTDYLWVRPADLPALVQTGAYRVSAGSLDGWGDGAIALKQDYAAQIGAKVGDRLKLNVRQGPPDVTAANPDVREYTVTALLETDSWKLPRAVIARPLPAASDRIRLIFANVAPAMIPTVREQVKALTQDMQYSMAEYSDAKTATAELRTQINQRLALVFAVGLIMAAVAAMSLMGTMVSSVSERRREFALLRSVGATPAQVQAQVRLEALLLGLVGGLVGVTGGAVLGFGALRGLGAEAGFVRLPWGLMAGGLAVSALLAILAVQGPARRVALD